MHQCAASCRGLFVRYNCKKLVKPNVDTSMSVHLLSSCPSHRSLLQVQYGNKLFQSDFIGIIQPGTSLIGLLQFNLLNSSVALVGYYVAAFTIDKPWMGRRKMQVNTSYFEASSMYSENHFTPSKKKCYNKQAKKLIFQLLCNQDCNPGNHKVAKQWPSCLQRLNCDKVLKDFGFLLAKIEAAGTSSALFCLM